MNSPPDVLVAIPARDEAARIQACVLSVLAAVRFARGRGMIGRATVAVAAHRCRDDTATRARSVLSTAPDVTSSILTIDEVMPVGSVRAEVIRQAGTQHEWLFSTDADSIVPPSWISSGLRLAGRASASMIVGLVDLTDVSPSVRVAHDQLVRAGVHADGSHDHVYAANLAVRLSTYTAVGGFPAVANGEEHALLAAVSGAGYPVLRTSAWRVATSGRTRGRARDGLGDLLGRLARAGVEQLDRPA